jgi:predicted HTH domain antitoxin
MIVGCLTMEITIHLPADIFESLRDRWGDVSRHALEIIAVEGYRTGALSETQVRRLLGLETRFEVHSLLKEHRVPLRYTQADLEEDLAAQRSLGILHGR